MSRATFATLETILGPRMAEILGWEDLKRATKIEAGHFMLNFVGFSSPFGLNISAILGPRIVPRVAKVALDIALTDYDKKTVP